MIVRSPPLQRGEELRRLLSRRPGPACQSGHPMTDGQIHPLNESRIHPPRKAQALQGDLESLLCSQPHHVRHPNQLAPSVAFLHLTVDQTWLHLPPAHVAASLTHLEPLTKVSCEGIEVQIQAITGEERDAAGSQDLAQGVNDPMRRVLRAGAEIQHGQKLSAGINGQPEPLYLRMAPQPRSQFVQLDVREPKLAEEAFVQSLCVLASTREPPRNRGVSKTEDPRGRRRVESLSQRREDQSHLMGRGFQTVHGGVTTRTEGGVARLTAVRLDRLRTPMLAIPDEGVELRIGIPEVLTLSVGTGEALGGYPLGGSPPAFHFGPGAHRRWLCTRRGRGGMTTGWAIIWRVWLEQTGEPDAFGHAL